MNLDSRSRDPANEPENSSTHRETSPSLQWREIEDAPGVFEAWRGGDRLIIDCVGMTLDMMNRPRPGETEPATLHAARHSEPDVVGDGMLHGLWLWMHHHPDAQFCIATLESASVDRLAEALAARLEDDDPQVLGAWLREHGIFELAEGWAPTPASPAEGC